jgi:hypothetical protein
MPFMINQLTGIMEAHKLKIDTLRPEPITSSSDVYRLPLRVSFKANLGELARTIDDIEKTLPVLSIEELGMRPAGDKSDLLQADMVVSLFAIADPNAPMPETLKLQHIKDNHVTVMISKPAHSKTVGKAKLKSQTARSNLAAPPLSPMGTRQNAFRINPNTAPDVGRYRPSGRRRNFPMDSSGQRPYGANEPRPAAVGSDGGVQ